MKNFKLTATLKRNTPTSTGSYVYLLKGSAESLKFFEENYDLLRKDDSTGDFIFFKKKMYMFGATLIFNAELEQPFQLEPSAKSALALAIMKDEMSLDLNSSSSASNKSEDDEDEDADFEAPAPKPIASTKKKSLK